MKIDFLWKKAVKNIKGNFLIIHGSEDEAVPFSAAENLHSRVGNSGLILVEKGNHTFGAKEPWLDFKLPTLLNAVVNDCIKFLKK